MTIIVVGAGPAGLAAAEAASSTGASVLLLDENPMGGGQIWRGGTLASRGFARTLAARPHVRGLHGARVAGVLAPNRLLLVTADGPRIETWSALVLCTGARELLLPFPGWTLPGVTGAGGLQALAKGGMPLRGKRVVVAGTGPLLLASAATAVQHGAEVCAIAEHRTTRELAAFAAALALHHPRKLMQAAALRWRLRGVPYLRGAALVEARGKGRLDSVVVAGHGEIACDFLAAGFGLVPNTELAALLGCEVGEGIIVDERQRTSIAGIWAAGECAGIGGVDKSLAEGRIAGLAAAGAPIPPALTKTREQACRFGKLLARSFAPSSGLRAMCRPETLVCRCEDVSAARLSAHADWRSAKLQTRAGMGFCQGRVCGSACEFLFGWEPPRASQPVFPITAATLASAAQHGDEA
jgi:NADPH-dependent 2,4-dienoyl-CoA reductase/sulfur reductase-like enzyme